MKLLQKLLRKTVKKKPYVIIQNLKDGEIVSETKYEVHPKFPNLTICGKEIPNPVPVAIPASVKKKMEGKSPRAMIKEMLAQEKAMLEADGYESEEEFFDVDIQDNNLKSSSEFNFELHEELLNAQNSEFMSETPAEQSEESEAKQKESTAEVVNEENDN
jgi:hypothetical protein